jgi:SAM-dependent methyltransferase
MSALPPDYDSDPARWASHDRSTYLQADIHEMVAPESCAQGCIPVFDMGCGDGRLQAVLPDGWPWIGIDSSPTQLSRIGAGRVAVADAAALPFTDGSFVAVTALWMLYHLDKPTWRSPRPTECYGRTVFSATFVQLDRPCHRYHSRKQCLSATKSSRTRQVSGPSH